MQKAKCDIPDISEIDCFFYHITTSFNDCRSIRQNGLVNLEKIYSNLESDLGSFLNENDIVILYDRECIKYKGKYYSIEYESGEKQPSKELYRDAHYGWAIGRKLYYDKGISGFYSISKNEKYASPIYKNPEILIDINRLLNADLLKKWHMSTKPYLVSALINVKDLEWSSSSTDKEKIVELIYKAFRIFKDGVYTDELVCDTNICIPPNRIITIQPFDYWNEC